jgi:undecaprenyl-diphosphatase
MNVLQLLYSFDLTVYHSLNGLAGKQFIDYLVNFEENTNVLKGALFFAIYWYFWISPGVGQYKRRRAILAILTGTLIALVVSRGIANWVSFRVRPMYDLHFPHRPYALPILPNLENWSSFPSDTSTFFFALAFGLACLSRRLAMPAMLYTAVWICLPRMYLGVHYASDIVAGAAIGVTAVYVSQRIRWIHSTLPERLLAWAEAKPSIFYMSAFLVSYEMSVLFNDVRLAARMAYHIVHISSVRPLL